jgi:hypothetical protein
MRLSILAVALAAFVSGATCASAQPAPQMTCRVDKDVRPAERAQPEQVALGLATALLNGDAATVDKSLTPEARAALGNGGLERQVRSVAGEAPYTDIRIAHTYLIEVQSGQDPLPLMNCGKSVIDPDAVLLAMHAVPQQAHIEVTARSRNNTWSIFVYLAPDQSAAWKVLSFEMHLAAMSGRSSQDLNKLALEQKSRGHSLNATLLMKAAVAATDRGPNVRTILRQDLQSALKSLDPPPEMAGEAPYPWVFDGRTYRIASLGVIGINGDLDLLIYRLADEWSGKGPADADSRVMISALVRAHPELRESFPAIIVRALKPDQSGGWATAYEFAKGFGQPPPPENAAP